MRVCVFACMHIHIRTHTYTHREEDRQSDSDTKTQRPTRILLPHISSYFKLVMKEWPSYPTITLKQQSHLKKVLTYNKHVLDHSYSDLPDIPKDLPTTSFLLACLCEWSSIGSWICLDMVFRIFSISPLRDLGKQNFTSFKHCLTRLLKIVISNGYREEFL